MKEEAVTFGEVKSLVGILTNPPAGNTTHLRTAVVLLNPGIVHRVGPGRIYVKIARALAAIGFVVLRFDFSGIGDSAVRHDNLCFEKSAIREAQSAMDFLATTRGIEHFILLGGCSGARISFQTACCDSRILSAIPINFPITDDEEGNPDLIEHRMAHYYWKLALFNPKSWRNLLTGRSDYQKIIQALRFRAKRRFGSGQAPSLESLQLVKDLGRLADRGLRLIFLYSETDARLEELREAGGGTLKRLCALKKVQLEIIPRADHTFSSLVDQERLFRVILKHIEAIAAPRRVVSAISDAEMARNSRRHARPGVVNPQSIGRIQVGKL